MSWFEKLLPSRIRTEGGTKKAVPEGLWAKCPSCNAVLYRAELERNLFVCPKCEHHMRISARVRLDKFLDADLTLLADIGDRGGERLLVANFVRVGRARTRDGLDHQRQADRGGCGADSLGAGRRRVPRRSQAGGVERRPGQHGRTRRIADQRHPVTGLDHVLAMVAVGIWGAQLGAPAIWVLPVTFPMVMALGGMAGLLGVGLPAVELGIGLSAILLGLMVALEARPPLGVAAGLVGFFGIFHGYAHGTELPGG